MTEPTILAVNSSPQVLAVNSSPQVLTIFRGEKGDAGSPTGFIGVVTSDSVSLQTNYNYFCTSLSLQTLTLPATANLGDRIEINGVEVGLFRVAQLDGQQIRVGNKVTSLGLSGRIDSLAVGDLITLTYQGSKRWIAKLTGNFEVA